MSRSINSGVKAGMPPRAVRSSGKVRRFTRRSTAIFRPASKACAFASDDDAAMAERLTELLENQEKAREFGAKGRKIAEEKFSCAAQLENTLNLYGFDER